MQLLEIVSFLGLGLVAGLLAGMLGIGGGVVVVPVLIWIFQLHDLPREIIKPARGWTSIARA
jgi:uncharacterized membrane protein YfcA